MVDVLRNVLGRLSLVYGNDVHEYFLFGVIEVNL